MLSMRRYALFASLFIFIAFLLPSEVRALSCMPPVLNAEAIETASVIFEGTVTKIVYEEERDPNDPLNMSQTGRYLFSVNKMWKGDPEQKEIVIDRGIYFGDKFPVGEKYLIVANSTDGNHGAHVCGNSVPIHSAGDKIEILKHAYGK